MTPCVDLHTHTTASDGALSPRELVAAAREAGVDLLSITDHDTQAAYQDLPSDPGLSVVPGVEFSSRWHGLGVHVVGLELDPLEPRAQEAVERQRRARGERAAAIARALDREDPEGLLAATLRRAGGSAPGRPHFAAELVARGRARDMKQAFARYLGAGKAGDVTVQWPELEHVVGAILDAGGIPVLAHPARYGLTRAKRGRLAAAFRDAGGRAIEVVSGSQNPAITHDLGRLAAELSLLASVGSDFHFPGQSWGRLGQSAALPEGCRPVWDHLRSP